MRRRRPTMSTTITRASRGAVDANQHITATVQKPNGCTTTQRTQFPQLQQQPDLPPEKRSQSSPARAEDETPPGIVEEKTTPEPENGGTVASDGGRGRGTDAGASPKPAGKNAAKNKRKKQKEKEKKRKEVVGGGKASVNSVGDQEPAHSGLFSSLPVSKATLQSLERVLNYDAMTPMQYAAIRAALAVSQPPDGGNGKNKTQDVFMSGALCGKTLAYLIPAVESVRKVRILQQLRRVENATDAAKKEGPEDQDGLPVCSVIVAPARQVLRIAEIARKLLRYHKTECDPGSTDEEPPRVLTLYSAKMDVVERAALKQSRNVWVIVASLERLLYHAGLLTSTDLNNNLVVHVLSPQCVACLVLDDAQEVLFKTKALEQQFYQQFSRKVSESIGDGVAGVGWRRLTIISTKYVKPKVLAVMSMLAKDPIFFNAEAKPGERGHISLDSATPPSTDSKTKPSVPTAAPLKTVASTSPTGLLMLTHHYVRIHYEARMDLLLLLLKRAGADAKVIVIFAVCAEVEFYSIIFRSFLPQSFALWKLHKQMKPLARKQTYTEFCAARCGILFTTDVINAATIREARQTILESNAGDDDEEVGSDLSCYPPVDWVVQYDLPDDAATYSHRCKNTKGRIGSDGQLKPAHTMLFILPHEHRFEVMMKEHKLHAQQLPLPPQLSSQKSLKEALGVLFLESSKLRHLGESMLTSYLKWAKCNIQHHEFEMPRGPLLNRVLHSHSMEETPRQAKFNQQLQQTVSADIGATLHSFENSRRSATLHEPEPQMRSLSSKRPRYRTDSAQQRKTPEKLPGWRIQTATPTPPSSKRPRY